MTYGWAILIIVIVAGVLYSFGIFNPSSSVSTAITGFSGLNVQGECGPNSVLILKLTNGLGTTINITKVNTTSGAASVNSNASLLIAPGLSGMVFVKNGCVNTSNTRYSSLVTITYTEPGSPFVGPYFSTGRIIGQSVSYTPGVSPVFYSNGGQIQTEHTSSLAVTGAFSISFWFESRVPSTTFDYEMLNSRDGSTPTTFDMQLLNSGSGLHGDIGNGTQWLSTGVNYVLSYNYNQFYNVLLTFNTTFAIIYVNGAEAAAISYGGTPGTPSLLGTNSYLVLGGFNGSLSNVQIYPEQLNAQQAQAIYTLGIFGSPINLPIAAWWPLDGNTLDFSGNSNNAAVVGTLTYS